MLLNYNALSVVKQLTERVYHHLYEKLRHQLLRRQKQQEATTTDIRQLSESLTTRKTWNPHIRHSLTFQPMPMRNSLPRIIKLWNSFECTRASTKTVKDIEQYNHNSAQLMTLKGAKLVFIRQ